MASAGAAEDGVEAVAVDAGSGIDADVDVDVSAGVGGISTIVLRAPRAMVGAVSRPPHLCASWSEQEPELQRR